MQNNQLILGISCDSNLYFFTCCVLGVVPTLCGFEEYLRATHMLYTLAKVLYTSNISTQEVEVEGP